MSLLCRLKNLVHKGVLKEKDLERIVIIPKDQEPCDCISRKSAILGIQRYGVGCFDADEFSAEQCERFVIDKLKKLPSVQPKQKTDVLDMIITEIESHIIESNGLDFNSALCIAIEIIDKYKEESEK